jgi:hypothetical protein
MNTIGGRELMSNGGDIGIHDVNWTKNEKGYSFEILHRSVYHIETKTHETRTLFNGEQFSFGAFKHVVQTNEKGDLIEIDLSELKQKVFDVCKADEEVSFDFDFLIYLFIYLAFYP